jgi:predicted amidohydrolase
MHDLKISIIQSDLHWEDAAANLQLFSEKIAEIAQETDLILLPEMFNTGFSMRPELVAEEMNGPTFNWMKSTASKMNCVIAGSLAVKEGDKYFNRLIWMRPDGSCKKYDKHHLFRYGHEQEHYSPGKAKLIVELKGWKICPLICYDLRFPVWSRNRWKAENDELRADYDLLIYVANWPEVRSHPWKTLLLARAIENQCFVAGLNRTGTDGNNHQYAGDSAVIDFRGQIISKTGGEPSVETVSLSYSSLFAFRKSFPAGMDADSFQLD